MDSRHLVANYFDWQQRKLKWLIVHINIILYALENFMLIIAIWNTNVHFIPDQCLDWYLLVNTKIIYLISYSNIILIYLKTSCLK